MITSWRLFNFKSFRNDTTVPLGPLTVLAGANSSGKSTLLQSMLMVAQTLESRVASRPVVLNGPLVRMGTFDSVRSYGSDAGEVLVGFVAETAKAWIRCDFSFDASGDNEISQLHPRLFASEARIHRHLPSEPFHEIVEVHRGPEQVRDPQEDLPRFPYYGSAVEGGEPQRLTVERFWHFLPTHGELDNPFPDFDPVDWQFGAQHDGVAPVQNAFAGIRYLGPLRDEPRALYPLSTTADTTDIGLRGEHTAAVYDLHRNDLVRYFPTSCFPTPGPSAPGINFDSRARTLESAVVEWLQYLGVVESLTTRDLGNLGHQLKVTTAGVTTGHDLTHVGTGVSQVLPIVVMGLLAAPDTTLLIEQPELHLHPRVQTLLGDFFLALAMAGRQVIVETHSEYLVNRLRYRIASAQGDHIARLVKTWFVEKDAQGASVFRAVDVNRFGAIPEWPKGFFDQSQREIEHILLAGATKKKAERTPGGR